MPTVLITGANRGLGLEFAKQYTRDGWQVIATCRVPDKAGDLRALAEENASVRIEMMDVADQ
jgi:NAD(P)-dependent dehydrogenase (short-subunit alcohol dehydrogenase family)